MSLALNEHQYNLQYYLNDIRDTLLQIHLNYTLITDFK